VFLRIFFVFATEEREGQIQAGGGSVQEIPETGHPEPELYRIAPRAVTGRPISGPPINTMKTMEGVINS
jgi:hypothetical protein